MIFSAPHSLRVGKVAARLRGKNFANDSPDTPDISPQAADAIIQEVRAAVPPTARLNARTIATIALNVYERLHTTVPGVLVSIGLLGAYAVTLLMALVFAGVALGYRLDKKADFTPAIPIIPQLVYDGERSTKGSLTIEDNANPPVTIIGAFATPDAARQAFEKIELPASSGGTLITLFGQSLFVTTVTPDVDRQKELQKNMSALARTVMMENRASNQAFVYLQCAARDESSAKELFSEIDGYLDMPFAFYLWPPWAAHDDVTENQKQSERRARATYRRLIDQEGKVHQHPRLRRISSQITSAIRSGDKAAIGPLQKEFGEAYDEIRQSEFKKLMESNDAGIDRDTVAIYLQRPQGTNSAVAEKKWHLDLGKRMGQVPFSGEASTRSAADVGTTTGFIHRKKNLLKLETLSFRRTDLGLPTLAEFLRTNGCSNIRYAITNFEADLDEDESEK
jgi:hypothetical protein